MKENRFSLDKCANISEEDFDLLERNGCKPQINDVLFSKDGTIGKTFVYKENQGVVLLSSVAIIRLFEEKLNPHFVCQVLKSDVFYNQLKGLTSGSAIRRLVLKAIKEIKLTVPPIEEQKKIAEVLSSMDEKLEVLSEKKKHYHELKQGLMQQLLTGKIRVKV
jgi:type I restriction enzyme S subunit